MLTDWLARITQHVPQWCHFVNGHFLALEIVHSSQIALCAVLKRVSYGLLFVIYIND